MKRAVSVILMTMVIVILAAATTFELRPELPQIKTSGQFSSVNLSGGQLYGEPGSPALPWLGTKILLPLGEEAVSISVKLSQPQIFKLDKPIEPIQSQFPFSQTDLPPLLGPDPAIYNSDLAWPRSVHNGVNTHFLAGHPINFSAVCPFEYYPLRNELVWYRLVSVTVESTPSVRASASLNLLKQYEFTVAKLERSIDNRDALLRYETRTSGYEYLIIYDNAK